MGNSGPPAPLYLQPPISPADTPGSATAGGAPLPVFTPPPPDPTLAATSAAAEAASLASLHTEAQMDSASLLARYGTQLSMANSQAGSPLNMKMA